MVKAAVEDSSTPHAPNAMAGVADTARSGSSAEILSDGDVTNTTVGEQIPRHVQQGSGNGRTVKTIDYNFRQFDCSFHLCCIALLAYTQCGMTPAACR